MRINKGVEWAVHACALLAPLPQDKGLSLAALAEYHGVPSAYMAKQMQALSKAGIVKTSRGQTGGYSLARVPADINLWDMTRAVDGPEPMFRCTEIRQQGPCASTPKHCIKACPIAAAFLSAENSYRTALRQVSLASILETIASENTPEELKRIFEWLNQNATVLPKSE